MGTTPRVIVVGAGMVGTLHAIEARRRGYEVLHFEIDPEPQQSSVRHLGGLRFGDRAAVVGMDVVRRAREAWLDLAAAAPGVGLRTCGSLTVATDDEHADMLGEAAKGPDAAALQLQLLPASQARAVEGSLGASVKVALRCGIDAVIEPRAALPALRSEILDGDGYRYFGGRQVWEAASGSVVDTSGRTHHGDLVLICTGSRASVLTRMLTARAPLRRVRVQLLQTSRSGPPLQSLLVDAHRASTEVDGMDVQVMCAQRSSGALTLGRAMEHEEPFSFDIPERPLAVLVERASQLIGGEVPPITRRWDATFHECTDGRPWYREAVDEGVVVVTGAGEDGVTIAPVMAQDTFDWLDGGPDLTARR